MGLLDRLLGRNKEFDDRIFTVDSDDESTSRLKGFNSTPIIGISQKLKKRFKSFDEVIDYLEEIDQTWLVTKNGQILDKYENFPEYETIMDDFYKKYGGGSYVIKALAPKTLRIGIYKIEGEDKLQTIDEKEEIRKKKEAKSNMTPEDEMFYDALKNNTDFKERYVETLMKRKLGVKEEKPEKEIKKSLDDLIAERVEKNPVLIEKLVDAEIEKRVGKEKPKKELSKEEQLVQIKEEWTTMKDLFGDKKDTGTNWGDVFKEFVKQGGISELVTTLSEVMKPSSEDELQKKLILKQLQERELIRPQLMEPESEPEPELVIDSPSAQVMTNSGRRINEVGGVVFAGKPEPNTTLQSTSSSQQLISPEVLQMLPYIPELIKSMTPEQAFDVLNSLSPESCDVLYSTNIAVLNVAIKHANTNIPESKGKLNDLLSEPGQVWLKRFLEINKEKIDKETALQKSEPTPTVPGDE